MIPFPPTNVTSLSFGKTSRRVAGNIASDDDLSVASSRNFVSARLPLLPTAIRCNYAITAISRASRSDESNKDEAKRRLRLSVDEKSCCELASDGKLGKGPKPPFRSAPAQWNYSTAASHGTKLVRDNFKLILTFI